MSSTNRGGKRHVSDYYVTPIPVVVKMLHELRKDCPQALEGWILDPCAGGDDNTPMSYPTALKEMGVHPWQITTVDIREDSKADIKADYLSWKPPYKYEMIITNPPFDQALEIIEKALTEVVDGGLVVMLLRLNFFGSDKRFSFWQQNMPAHTYVHYKRISFTGGPTDSIEYMHCVWQKGLKTCATQLRVI